MDKNDFYMVLNNRNSIHPNATDNSGHFTVAWDVPITFNAEDKWKVALTEISYMYDSHTISTNQSITYVYEEDVKTVVTCAADVKWKKDIFEFSNLATSNADYSITWSADKDSQLIGFTSSRRFMIDENDWFPEGDPQNHGAATQTKDGKHYHIETKRKVKQYLAGDETSRITVKIVFLNKKEYSTTQWFLQDIRFDKGADLAKHIRTHCAHIFQSFTFNKKMQFQMADNVSRVQFNKGLNFVLGYSNTTYSKATNAEIFVGDVEPKYKHGVGVFHIYASCCSPTYVENDYKPILGVIHVANEHYSFGLLYNLTLKHPMYVDVQSSGINSIEIKICNDAGHVITFPTGGSILLTLHFKKSSTINSCITKMELC